LGQVLIVATTAVFGTMFKLKPDILDPTLNWYARAEKFFGQLKAKFRGE
jgi:hypothetical protein